MTDKKQLNLAVVFFQVWAWCKQLPFFLSGLGKQPAMRSDLMIWKKEAKNMGMTFLRNKDKNTYLRAVASFLVQNKKVSIAAGVAFDKVSQDDVSISQDVSWSVTQKPYLWPVLSCSVFFLQAVVLWMKTSRISFFSSLKMDV